MSVDEPLLSCGHCGRPIAQWPNGTYRSLETLVLEDAFCSEDCYDAAWRERQGRPAPRASLPPEDVEEDDEWEEAVE
jgi:hypothetical protein